MKKVSIRKIRHDFRDILNDVMHGMEIAITDRGWIVAFLVPPRPTTSKKPIKMPNFENRFAQISGGTKKPTGIIDDLLAERKNSPW